MSVHNDDRERGFVLKTLRSTVAGDALCQALHTALIEPFLHWHAGGLGLQFHKHYEFEERCTRFR
jgi:hypothetical protein